MPGRCIIRVNVAVTTTAARTAEHFETRLAGEVRPGEPISRDTAVRLIRCSDSDLPRLLAAARSAKERFKPAEITYSRKVFIPLTNLCRDYCGYCTFRRDPGDPGAHTMTPEEVLDVARAGEMLGCTEALFSLGDKPELLFPEMRGDSSPSGLQVHAALSGSNVRTGSAGDEPAAASQSRAAERRMDCAAGRCFAQHGPDA